MDELTRKAYGLRRDVIEEVYRSAAGHVGGDLSVMDILTVLYFKVMNVSPENWNSSDRDRFFLSKGHLQRLWFKIYWTSKYRCAGHRDEFRLSGPWSGAGCGNRAGGEDGRQGISDLCGAGRRRDGGRL